MAKLLIEISTNKIGSRVQRTIELYEDDYNDEEMIEEIVEEKIHEMIYVDYEVIKKNPLSPKLVIKVSTNIVGSEVQKVIDIDNETMEEEIEVIVQENVTDMIYSDYKVIED